MRKSRTTGEGILRDVCAAIAAIVTAAMLPMALTPVKAIADDSTCSKEDSGVYHLTSDCTLHISKGVIHTTNGSTDIPDAPIGQKLKVKKIVIDDPANTSFYNNDASSWFSWYKNTESITGLEKMDMSHVTNTANMFNGLKNLKTPVDLSSWDLSSANNLDGMFSEANLDSFKGYGNFRIGGSNPDLYDMFARAYTTGSIDLSGWKIDSQDISSMQWMFEETKAPGGINIKGDLAKTGAKTNWGMFFSVDTSGIDGLDELNMSKTTDVNSMFCYAKITKPIDLSSWDMSSVTDANFMFERFDAPNEQDLSAWNMSSVTDSSGMFYGNSSFSKFKGMDKWDLSNVEDASNMYWGVRSSEPVRIATNMPKLKNTALMFGGADNIDNFANLSDLYIPNVSNASWMFQLATGTYLDMSKMGLSVTTLEMKGMLGAPGIRYIKLGSMFKGHEYKMTSSVFDIEDWSTGAAYNAWDDASLPSYNSTKHWSRLPYDDKDGKFDGTIESLGSGDSWMNQSMWWKSPHTGLSADNDLQSVVGNPGTIIFRTVTRPVRFHANTTGSVTGMPTMTSSTWASNIDGDRVPCKAPTGPAGSSKFREWNTKQDGTGTSYQPCDQLDHGVEAVDLYAQWGELKKVPIRFNDKSGQATDMPGNVEQHPGDHYTIPSKTPTRPGYRFKGWATTENGKPAYQPGDTITIGNDVDAIDLYPVWEQTGTGVLPAAGSSTGIILLGATVVATLLIPLSAVMIRRRRRL